MDGGGVAFGVTETGGGVGTLEAAFSKSSTCREAGRLLLPPMRPLICCARDLHPPTAAGLSTPYIAADTPKTPTATTATVTR